MVNDVDELARISQYFDLQAFLVDNPLIKMLVNYCMLELSITITVSAPAGDSLLVEMTRNF